MGLNNEILDFEEAPFTGVLIFDFLFFSKISEQFDQVA